MIITNEAITTITCDKCGKSSSANEDSYNNVFFNEGWGLFPNAKKYIHLCFNCLSPKYRKAMRFVKEQFN